MVEYTIFANNNLLYSSIEPDRGALLSPQLKMEVNKSGSLSFTMLPDHAYYNDIQPMKTVVTVYEDTTIIFFGRVIEAPIDFYKQKKVTCEGSLSFLLDTVIEPFTYDKKRQKTIQQVFSKIIGDHNSCLAGQDSWKQFSVGSVTMSETDYWEYKSYGDTLSTLMSELVDVYGGILRPRHSAGTYGDYTTVTNYLDYIKDPSQDPNSYTLNNQAVEFGVNLLDFEQEYPVSDIFTVLMPIGNDKLTIDGKYLVNQAAVNKFGRIIKVQQWSSIKKKDELRVKAQKYLDQHTKVYTDNLKVKAVDLHCLSSSNNRLKLLDRVKVYSEPHGFGTSSDLILFCLSAEMDLQNPENNSYLLGSHIPEYKDKAELSKKSSGGKSRGGGGGGKGTPKLSSMQNESTEDIQNTINEVYDQGTDTTKGIIAILGDKVSEALGFNISDLPSTGLVDKVNWLFGKLGIGNNGDSSKSFEVPDLTEMIENGIGAYREITDQGGRLTGSEGIKTLSDVTDDIVDINGRAIYIGNWDGSTSLVSIRARNIDVTASLKTFIGGYEIQIGDVNTEIFQLTAKHIDITGLIDNLLVKRLTAQTVETGWLFADKTIRTNRLYAADLVTAREVDASVIYATAIYEGTQMDGYFRVATKQYVDDRISALRTELKGYTDDEISLLEGRINNSIAALRSELQTWALNQHWTSLYNKDYPSTYYTSLPLTFRSALTELDTETGSFVSHTAYFYE